MRWRARFRLAMTCGILVAILAATALLVLVTAQSPVNRETNVDRELT